MRFLFFDTALDHLTAGLAQGERVIAKHCEPCPRGHADRLVPLLRDLMAASGVGFGDLEGIGCTRGPGTFTGIRSGIAAARAMGLAADLPAVGVPTLDALARTVITGRSAEAPVTAAIDARRGELYLRHFRPDGTPVGPPLRSAAETAGSLCPEGMRLLVGSGATILRDILGRGIPRPDISTPSPEALAVTLSQALRGRRGHGYTSGPKPLYLRPADATPPADWRQPPAVA